MGRRGHSCYKSGLSTEPSVRLEECLSGSSKGFSYEAWVLFAVLLGSMKGLEMERSQAWTCPEQYLQSSPRAQLQDWLDSEVEALAFWAVLLLLGRRANVKTILSSRLGCPEAHRALAQESSIC